MPHSVKYRSYSACTIHEGMSSSIKSYVSPESPTKLEESVAEHGVQYGIEHLLGDLGYSCKDDCTFSLSVNAILTRHSSVFLDNNSDLLIKEQIWLGADAFYKGMKSRLKWLHQ